MSSCAVTAAILAGGKATRLGGICKPLIEIAGRRILNRQLDVLRPLCDEIILLANDPSPFTSYGLAIVPDRRSNQGPLAGLESALVAARSDQVIIVAGDLPLVSAQLLHLLLDADRNADAAVPFTARGPEPLLARYAKRIHPMVSAALDANQLAVKSLLSQLHVARIEEPALRAVDPNLDCFLNVNTPEDVALVGPRAAGL